MNQSPSSTGDGARPAVRPTPHESSADATRITETELPEAHVLESSPNDGRHIIDVTLIRAGMSRNGNHYSEACLRESSSLFEGARAFVDHNHDDRLPERSVRDLAGHYTDVRLEEGRMRAHLHLIPGHDWIFNLLKESEGKPNLCGLSIDAYGERDPKSGEVRKLTSLNSVDIVTRPSAGGMFDRIIQSLSPNEPALPPPVARRSMAASHPSGPKENALMHEAAAPTQPSTDRTVDGDPSAVATPSQLASLLEQEQAEKHAALDELRRIRTLLNPNPGSSEPHAETHKLVEQIKRERDLERAGALLSATLQDSALPVAVAEKLRKQFSGRVFEAQTLELAIADEKSMLAALSQAGAVTGMGGYEKSVSVGMSAYDQLQAAMDGLFDLYESEEARRVPRLSGIREAFRIATGVDIGTVGGVDRPILESFASGLRSRAGSGQLLESEVTLREADVTTASFSYLLGTSMNKRLLSDYMAWPSEWQKFTTIVGIKDFKQQDRIRLGAFGSLSTVAEDAAYTTLTLSDTRAIYSATKRGNLVQVTRETIVNDDLYSIKQIPQKLAVAAAFTLAEFVYGLLSPNGGNIYDGNKLFDSVNHLNTGITTANLGTANSGAVLSSANLQTAVIAMRKQKNMANKPIGLKPRYLLVPPDLEFGAMTILKSAGLPGGNNNDINPMMGYAEPIVSPQLNSLLPASTSVWIAIADPRVIDTVEVGFVGGQANPVLLIQDMPLYGLNFTQDTISYKVRHEYGGAVVDYRGFYLGNN